MFKLNFYAVHGFYMVLKFELIMFSEFEYFFCVTYCIFKFIFVTVTYRVVCLSNMIYTYFMVCNAKIKKNNKWYMSWQLLVRCSLNLPKVTSGLWQHQVSSRLLYYFECQVNELGVPSLCMYQVQVSDLCVRMIHGTLLSQLYEWLQDFY